MTVDSRAQDESHGRVVGRHRTALATAPGELPARAAGLLAQGYRVALASGHDDGDQLRAVYLFTAASPERRVELHVSLDSPGRRLPSIAELSFPAGRFEREMHDLFGLVPDGHPLPRRLVRHFHWPRGWYPMRRDAGPPPAFADTDGPYPFRIVDGDGVYEIPVGPVHAGMIEPGHFRFSVVGETILNLKARLWFVHKGLESLFQGRTPAQALELAERISGDTSVGHALAFTLAVEDALGLRVPPEATAARAVLLELERLYNHVTDIGALCNDAGYRVLDAQAGRIRERLLRINADATGHRLLRGAVSPGAGALRQPPAPAVLAEIAAEVAQIVELALGHSVVRDRFAGTAVLTQAQAHDLGTLGYVARASGIATDARHDHPFIDPVPAFSMHTEHTGDVLARFKVRAAEIQTSVEMISQLLAASPATSSSSLSASSSPSANASGVGIVEGWRGTIVHRIELGPDGTLTRVKIVDPSFLNWPALPVAMTDTIVPDFPLSNKSFNLSYAGNDL